MKHLSVLLMMVVLLGSCRTVHDMQKVYVIKTDTLYSSVLVHDSIYVNDSTVIREKGDTIFSDRWHTKYIERLRTDTLYKTRIDSVKVEIVRDKEMTSTERAGLFIKDSLITTGMFGITLVLLYLWHRFRHRW